MNHNEFVIGANFWCSGKLWRCTDIGTRVIVAIRLDRVDVESTSPELRRTLVYAEAEAEADRRELLDAKGPDANASETKVDLIRKKFGDGHQPS